jgi:hypothetical protein
LRSTSSRFTNALFFTNAERLFGPHLPGKSQLKKAAVENFRKFPESGYCTAKGL